MSLIRNRTDVTEWLIHFVRDRDLQSEWPEGIEQSGFATPRLEHDANSYAVLMAIVEAGALLPGFSFRNRRTTIYGGKPVVCFTEAPIYDFVRYVNDRRRHTRCSQYGVCLLKAEVFAAGGRPAIYGLSGSAPKLIQDSETARVIDPAVLPAGEQFRYVPYDPTRSDPPLDWTHEREWRWAAADTEYHRILYPGMDDTETYPALPLFKSAERGGFFSRIGFLVPTRAEARDLAKLILACADAHGNDIGEEFSAALLRNAFVVPVEEVRPSGTRRIEDLSRVMKIRATRAKASAAKVAEVRRHVLEAARIGTEAARIYVAESTNKTPDGFIRDVSGGAWVTTLDSTSEVTAALLQAGLAKSMVGGEYYRVKVEFVTSDQALSVDVVAAQAAATYLEAQLGQAFDIRSWLD